MRYDGQVGVCWEMNEKWELGGVWAQRKMYVKAQKCGRIVIHLARSWTNGEVRVVGQERQAKGICVP